MKLSEVSDIFITESSPALNEAPVGLFKSAMTKLKKRIPLAPGIRARAEGEDMTNKAANQLAIAFLRWSGQTKKDLNKITPQDLMTFFSNEGYAVTAQDIVDQAVAQKTPKAEPHKQEVKQAEKGEEKKEKPKAAKPRIRLQPGDPAKASAEIKKAYQKAGLVASESYEYRLRSFLGEDAESPVSFNKKEVEKIILAVVAKVAEKKPEALAHKVAKTEKEPEQVAASPSSNETGISSDISDEMMDEVIDRYGEYFGEFTHRLTGEVNARNDVPAKAKQELEQRIKEIAQELVTDMQHDIR